MTALIEEDHFLYLSSFMDKYFSGNAFKFLIFFNLLTFNKRVLNLAGSLARSESHLLCVVIGCSPLVRVDRESWWSASRYQESQIAVVWFCQLKTYPITLNLFIYHHGTGPRSPPHDRRHVDVTWHESPLFGFGSSLWHLSEKKGNKR